MKLKTYGDPAWMCACENFHLMQVRSCHSCGQVAPPIQEQDAKTLRDDFAGQALPAVMNRMHEGIQNLGSPTFPQNVSAHAYAIADAMLDERKRKENG